MPPCTPRKPKYMPIAVQRIACCPLIAAAPAYRAAVRWPAKFRGPTGRTCTCRRRRQVRDLIIAYIGRPANFPCPPRQRQRGAGPWPIPCGTFFRRIEIDQKEIQKPRVFGGVLSHISFAAERNGAAGGKRFGKAFCAGDTESFSRVGGRNIPRCAGTFPAPR